ncbi:MAG: hypothetical protein J0L97_02590 [Alphaproteobacteria bacterium]|nr:hypothetical protein [Alphaproteobacteria bacterium]
MSSQPVIEEQGYILSSGSSVSFDFIEVATRRTGSVSVSFDRGDEIRIHQQFSDEAQPRIADFQLNEDGGYKLLPDSRHSSVIGADDLISLALSVYAAKQLAPQKFQQRPEVDYIGDLMLAAGQLWQKATSWVETAYHNAFGGGTPRTPGS